MSDDAIRPNSADVIATLVENHREFLRFLERRVASRADAEDILQEAFVRGVARADSVRDGESAVAWFYRMLRNAVIDHYRRRGAAARFVESLAAELDDTAAATETRDAVCRCVLRLAETLKPEYADALRRIEVSGQSVKDWAAEVGIEANNAGVRLHRAREALRRQVQASCGTCAEHGCMDCSCAGAAPSASSRDGSEPRSDRR